MMNLLGSHDVARFIHFARGDTSALRLATLFQMTFPGAPSIYYGDEIGLAGGHDPDNRRAFPWDDKHAWDHDLLHEMQRLIQLRNQYPALRRGSFDFLHAAGDVAAYVRKLDGEAVVVVINAGKQTHQVDVPTLGHLPDGTMLVEAWTHKPIRVEEGRIAGLDLAPRSGRSSCWKRRAMTPEPPPAWQLPEGVDPALWRYAHTPRLAVEEDEYFAGHPLFARDARLLDDRFVEPGYHWSTSAPGPGGTRSASPRGASP